MLSLLDFLVVVNEQKLSNAIRKLESFPDLPEFTALRSIHHKLKYSGGPFTLKQVTKTVCGIFFFFSTSVLEPLTLDLPLPLSAGDFPLFVSGLVQLLAADEAGGSEGAEQTAARQQGADQRAAQGEPW